ncbi:beta-propeller domain-containing protein [Actinomadura fibrosa]|uniref:Beta-propeller domain-containing protein n=1 Tax=Actinomadura fibrosa TaxID=111802 RepID=A0ABW2Y1M4_9ACTN|nr:beta-propeller domain-containing protein [Actinomadura fibrosa]
MRARLLALTASAAIVLPALGCTGSSDTPARPGPVEPQRIRLVNYSGCDAVLDGLRRATADQVGPYGLDGWARTRLPDGDTAFGAPGVPGRAEAQAPAHSNTNAHEPDADEPDTVKTDGRRIIALAAGRLRVIDPATRKVTHTLDLRDREHRWDPEGAGQLLLSGDRALVLTSRSLMAVDDVGPGGRPAPIGARTDLTLIDLSGAPKVIGTMTSDAAYLDARQNGTVVRVVLRSTPRIAFPSPQEGGKEATERNRVEVWKAPLDAFLPAFTVNEGGQAVTYRTPCDQVGHPAAYAGAGLFSVLTFDLARGLRDPSPVSVSADGLNTAVPHVYGTGSSLYIASPPPPGPVDFSKPESDPGPVVYRTDVHKFDVSQPGRPRYAASGSVQGSLLNQYAMSEFHGDLRLATTTTGEPSRRSASSQSSVYVLAQKGARLEQAGRVDGLGKGERIYAVRFLGALAYVVTFRQVDPLYVLDLADPDRPRLTGELKIRGYSAYLHPMADGRLLGIGQDADAAGTAGGMQASLFDVGGAPRRVGAFTLPGASSGVGFDPHAFLYWPATGLTVVPVIQSATGAGEALVLKITGTGIKHAGTIGHPGKDYGSSIQRSLVIGGTLWTFSRSGARATDATTLADRGWIPYGA